MQEETPDSSGSIMTLRQKLNLVFCRLSRLPSIPWGDSIYSTERTLFVLRVSFISKCNAYCMTSFSVVMAANKMAFFPGSTFLGDREAPSMTSKVMDR